MIFLQLTILKIYWKSSRNQRNQVEITEIKEIKEINNKIRNIVHIF